MTKPALSLSITKGLPNIMTLLTTCKLNLRLRTILFLAFASGLPLALTSSTLQAWYTEAGVDLLTIGVLTLVGLPYVWKFLWAPMMDYVVPPWLGRRRGWIFFMQLGLCITLFWLANENPAISPVRMGFLALLIAFLSASQDIAVDAYRADILLPKERGLGAACTIFAFRMAMLVSGGLALMMADQIGWKLTYEIMAILMALSLLATWRGPNPSQTGLPSLHFSAVIIEPFKDLWQRENIFAVLLFVIFYKLGDAFALTLMSNFLLKGLGFSLTEVGIVYKIVGLFATLLGAFVGGFLLARVSLYTGLLWFGLAQAFSNVMFVLLAYTGKNYSLMVATLSIESFCSGMSTAAFLAFLMSLCHARYSATQFALLSALAAIGRVFLGPLASVIVARAGWVDFYLSAFFLCFPGIMILFFLRNKVQFNVEAAEY